MAHGLGPCALSYRELKRKSDQLAELLQKKGVRQEIIVGIMVERSIQLLVGILAILKAGGAFLPIDPDYPRERIDYILADSGASVLLTTGVTEIAGREICNKTSVSSVAKKNQLAYIIYTSGSTGKPKGVMIHHRGVINLIASHKEVFKEDESERISQVASIGFGAAIFEIFPCLLSGASLYIVDDEIRLAPVKLKDWLIKMNITMTFQSTAVTELLLGMAWPGKNGTALRKIRTAGERLTLCNYTAREYPFELYNLYGSTEDTVWTTWARVSRQTGADGAPSIGIPIKNKKAY